MPIGDVYEIKFQMQESLQLGMNVRHYRVVTSTPPEPPLDAIAAQLGGIFAPLYLLLLSSEADYVLTSARRIFPLPLTIEGVSNAGAGAGAIAGDLLPKQVAGIITLRSALAGRRNRGRAYIPFPSETSNTATATPVAAYIAALAILGVAYTADRTITVGAGSIVLRPVIWRRASSSSVDITSSLARSVWATQRRRGDYGRPNLPPS
jgi:hypothetical protein